MSHNGKNAREHFLHAPLGYRFKLIGEQLHLRINRELEAEDLTFAQLGILHYLADHRDQAMNQKELCVVFHVSHPTMVGLVKRLEEKGFIECTVDETNRRQRRILATDKALECVEKHNQSRSTTEKLLVKGMNEEETTELLRLLTVVYDNLTGTAKENKEGETDD